MQSLAPSFLYHAPYTERVSSIFAVFCCILLHRDCDTRIEGHKLAPQSIPSTPHKIVAAPSSLSLILCVLAMSFGATLLTFIIRLTLVLLTSLPHYNMSSTNNNANEEGQGIVQTVVDAVSSAAAAAGNAASELADRVTHLAGAAEEKTEEKGAEASKETNKAIAKDSNAGVTDRISAAGHALKDGMDEKKHEAKYEAEKKQATK